MTEEKKESSGKLKKGLIILLIVSVVLLSLYGLLRYLISIDTISEDVFWQTFKLWSVIILTAILCFFVVYYGVNKFFEGKSKDDLEINPKEYIDAKPTIRAYMEDFCLDYGIPCYYDYSEDKPKIVPAKQYYIESNYQQPFNHKTGIPFVRFEISASVGTKPGIHTAILRLDRGLEFAKNNAVLIENTSLIKHKLDERNFSLATVQDDNLRLKMRMLELREEGLSERELAPIKTFETKENRTPQELPEEVQNQIQESNQLEIAEKRRKIYGK